MIDYGREDQQIIRDWQSKIGNVKNNVRAKQLISVTRIYRDEKDPDVINVCMMSQVDTGTTGVAGYAVNKLLPTILIKWGNNLNKFMIEHYEKA